MDFQVKNTEKFVLRFNHVTWVVINKLVVFSPLLLPSVKLPSSELTSPPVKFQTLCQSEAGKPVVYGSYGEENSYSLLKADL